jgi:hypothetical protein
MGPHEITIKEGLPVVARANFRIEHKVVHKGELQPFHELNQKYNAKPVISLRRTGFIFKTDHLYVNSNLVNTEGRRISFVRNAYYFAGGILATIQPRGTRANDGPVELIFIDLKTMNARFVSYGSKIYWPLELVEIPSSHLVSINSNPQ